MTKRQGDQTPEPEGGRAAERLRQFREARQPSPAPEEDTEPTEQDMAPDEASSHDADEPAMREDDD
jgi:hypothetical protein